MRKHDEIKALPAAFELQDACRTITGFPTPNDQLATRLQLVADLMADAGPLPTVPILLWREPDQAVSHAVVGSGLTVGRQAGAKGLSLPQDKLLSRSHFAVRLTAGAYTLEDLESRNGTAVNHSEDRVKNRVLRDGDLILAGSHIFVFLDQRRTD